MSAAEIGRLVGAKRLSAREVTEAALRRIRDGDAAIHAWESVDEEYALRQAAVVDARIESGGEAGCMAGAPLGVKDVFNTEVLPTRMGSAIWRDHHAGNDARVVAQLRWAGAIIVGKTVTAEFAVHEPGPTRNPHNLDRTPGTSSSGSAAAVSAGMVPVALGTQTAGSLIRPASFCGIFAFKPTFGWLPRTGVLKTTDTLDQIGFHVRHMDDARLLFEAARIGGRDHPLKEERLASFPEKRNWRVGLARTHLWNEAPDYARRVLLDFAESIRCNAIEVVDTDLPAGFNRAHDVHAAIYDSDLSYYFRREMNIDERSVSAQLREIIRSGMRIPPDRYQEALRQQAALAGGLDRHMAESGIDMLLTLSSNGEAPMTEPIPFRDPCAIFSLCGMPTVSMPAFSSPSGLPFGAQIAARKYADRLLLDFAEYLVAQGLAPAAKIASAQT
ncbi:MAG: amidase [Candidatus Nitricoxidivorans perseverans]|uniref:Amidase n=1 Tax=Candidatus Nitricoxidivorans perseverans TaxID=2975601 RepID=A0AA49IVD8_9PROT|nr:MAG: amidase [Candidatus Nitricoxidivorans perseverans]